MKILVINPGSTSTKIAIYEDEKEIWSKTIEHSKEELSKFKRFQTSLNSEKKQF